MGFQAERDIYDVPATPPFARTTKLQNPTIETTIRLSAKDSGPYFEIEEAVFFGISHPLGDPQVFTHRAALKLTTQCFDLWIHRCRLTLLPSGVSQTYGWDNSDESGSVSSMSSGRKATHCHICRQEEKPTKPPKWRCSRCGGTSTGTNISTSTSTSTSTRPSWQNVMLRSSPFSHSSPKPLDSESRLHKPVPLDELTEFHPTSNNTCEVYGCTTLAFRNTDGVRVCKRHEVETRHKSATSQKLGVAMKTATLPRSNKKSKLYPLKPEHNAQALKRKRSSGVQKIAGHSGSSRSLGEGVTHRSPSSIVSNTHLGSNNINGANLENRHIYEQPETPEYEPPPPILDNSPSPWLSVGENPESQLVEEARANRESSTIYVDVPGQWIHWDEATRKGNQKSPRTIVPEDASIRKGLQTISPPESSGPQDSRHGSSSGAPATPSAEEYPLEVSESGLTVQNAEAGNTIKLNVKPEHHENKPSDDAPKPPSNPEIQGSINEELPNSTDKADITASKLDPIEVTQQTKKSSFDESVLDRFLSAQIREIPSPRSNSFNLLNGQQWAHIDPREAWPTEANPDWLAEKQKEVEARPKRKANFGKVLTVQNIKERRENGWHIHQNKALPTRDYKGYGHIEELFAVKGIEELEPSVRNGVLVMAEKAFDENGKRRKKNSIRVFPVS
ncbi:hypothetical protein B7463_g11011, partial [Scytalidium lignicola]